ncbi:hypothetical protein fugu_003830 [Takifugu bimaculatus]|uniref:Protein adenylyltransferase FICD n=1 Tax=Takifugu bimaculatus TaxID=433685 RepID=A0A4Z2BDP5_9TELE|nr:hypothetical protein fugu_003830 [Takifugu bimaculatus]
MELEAKAALQQALEMRKLGKREKAQKLLVHALSMNPEFVDALTELGTILEEEKDVVQADHLYSKALAISPCNEKALVSKDRTLPLVEEIDQRYFGIIDSKVRRLMSIPKGNSALRRVMEETYYHHIYHTVAIEGNTLTLSEIRHIIETRYAVPGKSLQEQNEAIGVDAAMKYINATLLSRSGMMTLGDILEIHRRVLGYVDPVEGGRLRTNQVFVGHHIPPHPRDLQRHMEELVQWLNSEEALQLHPVEFAALAHYKLVYVHPFVDGNGRTSRLLMNLVLLQAAVPAHHHTQRATSRVLHGSGHGQRGRRSALHSLHSQMHRDDVGHFVDFHDRTTLWGCPQPVRTSLVQTANRPSQSTTEAARAKDMTCQHVGNG